MVVGLQSTAFARDITLSMWTHNQLYVDYFNSFLEDIRAEFPDDNINFDFQVQPDVTTSSLTAIGSGTEHPDLFGLMGLDYTWQMILSLITFSFNGYVWRYVTMESWKSCCMDTFRWRSTQLKVKVLHSLLLSTSYF